MATIKVNAFGKGGSTSKTASPDGLATMKKSGATKATGVNTNKGYPAAGNMSGDRGGMPGSSTKGNGTFGGARRVNNVHMSQPGSGHVMSEAKRSSMTGFTQQLVTSKTPGDVKVSAYGKKR